MLTFSRGSIAAAVIGLAVLLALAPSRAQLRGAVIATVAAAASGGLAAALPAVRTLEGERTTEGLVLLAGLVAAGAVAAVLAARPEPAGGDAVAASDGAARRRGVRRAWVAAALVAALALALGAAAIESGPRAGSPQDGATAARLGSAESNRYAYWRVALDGFADRPLQGQGAGSFGVLWLRDRTVPEVVRDAHSIWIETAAELGLAGLVLLAALVAGVAVSGVRARRSAPAAVAGPAAALAVWAAHSAIDWDWEMPGGATLTAVVLAGLLIALADP